MEGHPVEEAVDDLRLPVPRLELRTRVPEDDRYRWTWDYRLVYRHYTNVLLGVRLGQTRVVSESPVVNAAHTKLCLPFRESHHLVHDAQELKLRAFAIAGDMIVEVFEHDDQIQQQVLYP